MQTRDKSGRFVKGSKGYWGGKKGDKRLSDENHWNWKGDNVSYSQLHKWARKQFIVEYCWLCESTGRLEMANINGIYTKSGSTWAVLCVRCHRMIDCHPFMTRKSMVR